MFSAIKSFIIGNDSSSTSSSYNNNPSLQSNNILTESNRLKSELSSNNTKKTIIKGEKKNNFDFSEEYEDDPKLPSTSENSQNSQNSLINDENIIFNNPVQKINDIDFWRMAHCIYVKNSLININSLNYVPFIKIKKINEGLFSYIGLGQENIKEIKYLAGFDEHFIYMINLNKNENKDDNDGMKTIGNHYDLHHITNVEICEDDNYKNKILIIILFVLDNDIDNYISKIKKFYFEKPNALKFLKLLKIYLNTYKIKISYKDNIFKNINFNESEEKEKNHDINEDIKENQNEKEKLINNNENNNNDNNKENEEEFTSDNVEDKEKNNEEEKKDSNSTNNIDNKDNEINNNININNNEKEEKDN